MSKRPDFVIAGAARCGTTALFEYLSQHPSVFMPREKEPGFFSSDVPGGLTSLEAYRALFAAAPPDSVTGEASTRYLYSRLAAARLLAHNPQVKVIVMLRHPVEAAQSLHGYAYRYRREQHADFEAAWRAQAQSSATPEGLLVEYDYPATYRYAEQVARVLKQVPAPQRHFVVAEEFFADPSAQFARILAFLGLSAVPARAFPVVNQYVGVRSAGLERFLRQPPALLRRLHAPLRPLLRAIGWRPEQTLGQLNWAHRQKPPLRPAFRVELERYFAADIAELERLLGRRLWSAPAAGRSGSSGAPHPTVADGR